MQGVIAILALTYVTVTLAQMPLPAPRVLFPPDSSNVPALGKSGDVELTWSAVHGARSYHLETYSNVYMKRQHNLPANSTSFKERFWYSSDEPRWWVTAVDAKGYFGYTTYASFLYGDRTKCRCACPSN